MRPLAIVLVACLAQGCYAYIPVSTASPAVGANVRATLTDSGTAALSGYLGARIASVDGRLQSSTDSSLTLAVAVVRSRTADESFWKGERITLRRDLIATVEQRRLSRPRTALSLGGALAVIATAAVVSGGKNGGSPGGDRPPPR
ncbi:MAG: hypothetical protein H7Z74_13440 [Anaerolineae bacterium]|nr:hypothetical protein [Gemmatimonadaceae bacterium]